MGAMCFVKVTEASDEWLFLIEQAIAATMKHPKRVAANTREANFFIFRLSPFAFRLLPLRSSNPHPQSYIPPNRLTSPRLSIRPISHRRAVCSGYSDFRRNCYDGIRSAKSFP